VDGDLSGGSINKHLYKFSPPKHKLWHNLKMENIKNKKL
jgi:hypothetical protein